MNPLTFPHGVMFHHFHDDEKHIKSQGSLSGSELCKLIDFYSRDHFVLSADKFLERFESGKLGDRDVCLTFDDGLRCQYDIAVEVLRHKGLKAFWFVYTSPLEGEYERLEIYHHFRFSMFSDVNDYYNEFYDCVLSQGFEIHNLLKDFNADKYLVDSPFYTVEDKKFRYIRDRILGQENYYRIMDRMLIDYKYNFDDAVNHLWIGAEELRVLQKEGHYIGVHSHTHPTRIIDKGYDGQFCEYLRCKDVLSRILSDDIISASYPCGLYDENTINIMKKIGIKMAFTAFLKQPLYGEKEFEIPRADCSNIMKEMKL